MIHIHPWNDQRHFTRTFDTEDICFLKDSKERQNLETEGKKKLRSTFTGISSGTENAACTESTKTSSVSLSELNRGQEPDAEVRRGGTRLHTHVLALGRLPREDCLRPGVWG